MAKASKEVGKKSKALIIKEKHEQIKLNYIGRPPAEFKEEYCQMLIDHMASGLSFDSFAGVISCNRDTLYEWVKQFNIFSDSKKEGEQKNLLFWEKLGKDNILNVSKSESTGKGNTKSMSKSLNSSVYIFNLKNRFPKQWRDRNETEITLDSKSDLNEKELKELLKKQLEALKKYES
jgi:hypothetical protein